ncbi:ion channel [Alteromonadaceae bacterium 2753L.S.0a.02]|nr:ion channel [Alteromonadaceae bacterium 2753L.S.0a.02]
MNDRFWLKHLVRENEFRFGLLLAGLFATLLIPPYFQDSPAFTTIWSVSFTGLLLIAIYAIGGKQKLLVPSLVLLVPALLTQWGGKFAGDNAVVFYLDNITRICFLSFVTYHLGRYIFKARVVSTNVIYAAMCIYLLIGFIWAAVFSNIHHYFPEAYNFANAEMYQAIQGNIEMSHFVYFSFVTLSTLGYGDITPVHTVAQSWAAVEAMVGQFYVAIVLARLVGMQTSRRD